MGVIDDSKLKAKENSVNGLMDAVKLTYSTASLKNSSLKLPITANINNGSITIEQDGNTVEVSYNGEKPISGKIVMDYDGTLTAVDIKYSDGYICTMKLGENGCTKGENIIPTIKPSMIEGTENDFNENTRKIFKGNVNNNYIELYEDNTPVLYRIIAIETDGSVKVVRNEIVTSMPYDSNNGSSNIATNDFEVIAYLNTTFYNSLAESTKQVIINHDFKLIPSSFIDGWGTGKGKNITQLYSENAGSNIWNGKIGLIELRDWFNASDNGGCKPEISGGYYNISLSNAAQNQNTYVCSKDNYLYLNEQNWWTITPSSHLSNQVFLVNKAGFVQDGNVISPFGIRPTMYLSSNIELLGNGTTDSQYKIKN